MTDVPKEKGLHGVLAGAEKIIHEIYNDPKFREVLSHARDNVGTMASKFAGRHVDMLATVLADLPNGTIKVPDLMQKLRTAGVPMDPTIADILGGCESITKTGNRFEIVRKADFHKNTELGPKIPGAEKTINLGKKITFDVETGENPRITHVTGLTITAHLKFAGTEIRKDVQITGLSTKRKPDGSYSYQIDTEMDGKVQKLPLNPLARNAQSFAPQYLEFTKIAGTPF